MAILDKIYIRSGLYNVYDNSVYMYSVSSFDGIYRLVSRKAVGGLFTNIAQFFLKVEHMDAQ